MNHVFWILIWIASPSGGHSEIYPDLVTCNTERADVLKADDTLFISDCTEIDMYFVKPVQQEYKKPSDLPARAPAPPPF